MIKIVKEGMCKNCHFAELELNYVYCQGDKLWSIRCTNEFLCEDWQNRLQREEGESNE